MKIRIRVFAGAVLAMAAVSVVAQSDTAIADKYKPAADKLIQAALTDTDGYADLQYLTDHIGKRVSGSDSLLKAIDWGAETMRKAGFQNVRVQPVMVPHWVRGQESGSIVAPVVKPLHMLGLGMSVGTPKGGVTAEVVFIKNLQELADSPAEKIKGKIVVFNPGWLGYGVGSLHRTAGPSAAAAKGAVAVLVRSATGAVFQLPHTGTLVYDEKQPKVPAAAISAEDALMIERLTKEGPVKVHLEMQAHMEAEQKAGNVIGEIPGREHPEQVVVLGGHIDSWDVGQGAQDDGSGIMATFEAASLIHKLGLKPKRTIRVVFWVNEENGGRGGKAYGELVKADIANQVAAIEMDSGAEKPVGFGYSVTGGGGGGGAAARARRAQANGDVAGAATAAGAPGGGMGAPGGRGPDESRLTPDEKKAWDAAKQIASLLKSVDADSVAPGGGGEDISPVIAMGVPGLAPRQGGGHYFDWHHTEADTLDKVDVEDFRKNIAVLSVLTYVLADMDGRLVGHVSQNAAE